MTKTYFSPLKQEHVKTSIKGRCIFKDCKSGFYKHLVAGPAWPPQVQASTTSFVFRGTTAAPFGVTEACSLPHIVHRRQKQHDTQDLRRYASRSDPPESREGLASECGGVRRCYTCSSPLNAAAGKNKLRVSRRRNAIATHYLSE